jgi:transcription elongation GreA/GreB family factor
MSRAFVKEDDVGLAAIPERPASSHPNYITPNGLEALRTRLRELEQRRRQIDQTGGLVDSDARLVAERDIAYVHERLSRAIVIDPSSQPGGRVAFGAAVETVDEHGNQRGFRIVGEDEADPSQGKLSWVSPLARALDGAEIGDIVVWVRPAGDLNLEVVAIAYTKT